ncbi:hypothetical protein RI129_012646 [Pyrocoelia pectoralis]|uniref:Arrestin C-terminal-like domain-containing protein n=1 Tax=Pyrocoelia pectoralis TaxID=417401 RepID=A0AAN7V387_9COLE
MFSVCFLTIGGKIVCVPRRKSNIPRITSSGNRKISSLLSSSRGAPDLDEAGEESARSVSYEPNQNWLQISCGTLSFFVGETKFEPGHYSYPFTFNLPGDLPSSMDSTYGNVKYKAKAKVDKEWSIDYTCKKFFTVYTCNYLSTMFCVTVTSPIELVEEKIPSSLSVNGPIRLTVNLPKDCYAPNDMVTFVAKIKNDSSTTVKELRFEIVQKFSFQNNTKSREDILSGSEEFAVIDSVVEPHTEKLWDLELRVPANTFIGTLPNCETIKVHWILKGEVRLPFPHRNMNIEVPLILGSNAAPTQVL